MASRDTHARMSLVTPQGLVWTSMDADTVASSRNLFHARFLCSLLQLFVERGQR